MHKRLKKTLKDERLRDLATFPFLAEGHDPRNVPAWMGLVAYLEQRFGTWHVPGGMARIAEVLAARLATRGVTVLRGTPARDVVLRKGRAVAVAADLCTWAAMRLGEQRCGSVARVLMLDATGSQGRADLR